MSLSDKLSTAVPIRTNAGCITCAYLDALPAADREAFDQWVTGGHSQTQLWEVCCEEGLDISISGFRHHMKHHRPTA